MELLDGGGVDSGRNSVLPAEGFPALVQHLTREVGLLTDFKNAHLPLGDPMGDLLRLDAEAYTNKGLNKELVIATLEVKFMCIRMMLIQPFPADVNWASYICISLWVTFCFSLPP